MAIVDVYIINTSLDNNKFCILRGMSIHNTSRIGSSMGRNLREERSLDQMCRYSNNNKYIMDTSSYE